MQGQVQRLGGVTAAVIGGFCEHPSPAVHEHIAMCAARAAPDTAAQHGWTEKKATAYERCRIRQRLATGAWREFRENETARLPFVSPSAERGKRASSVKKKTHASLKPEMLNSRAMISMCLTSNLLTLFFVLTAYGADLAPPLGVSSESTHEAPTNVSAYPTTQSATKSVADLTRSAVLPRRPRNYPQGDFTPHARLATTPRSPPRLTDSIDVQRKPNVCTADPAQNICSAEPVLSSNEMVWPASYDTDASDMGNFMKKLTGDATGQKCTWVLFSKKNPPTNMCRNGPELSYTMTRTCIAPAYHSKSPPPPPPPLSFCCELLCMITVSLISAALVLSTAGVFGFAKQFDKLTGVKIPCRELLFIFLTLFPAPGAAATQGLADQSSIQVAVYNTTNATNASASTAMAAVDTVTSWAQLVTACNATSANITLSPTFQMGVYSNQIDFRLVAELISLCMVL
jgi:hypothetical protein